MIQSCHILIVIYNISLFNNANAGGFELSPSSGTLELHARPLQTCKGSLGSSTVLRLLQASMHACKSGTGKAVDPILARPTAPLFAVDLKCHACRHEKPAQYIPAAEMGEM